MSLSPALQRIGVKLPEQVIAMLKRAGELREQANTIKQILQDHGINDSKIELNPEENQIILTVRRQDGHLIGEIKKNVQANTGLGVREEVALSDRTKVQLVFAFEGYTYEESLVEKVEDILDVLRKEQGLKLEGFTVLEVKKEERPKLDLPGAKPENIHEPGPVAFIETPGTVGPKVLQLIRETVWREAGIPVIFCPNSST